MCGIAGIVNPPFLPEQWCQGVLSLLAHRGPDQSGVYSSKDAGLAVCRLAIIDPAGGRQPIANERRNVWLVCNGEIFNAPTLRAELERYGHRFRTRSDCEVILHGYEEWEYEIVGRLQGMFAFAIWDELRRRLVLARDRFGMKPLFYGSCSGAFAFASQIRSVFSLLPELWPEPNRVALWRLFEIGFIPTPLTAFEEIHQVLPANILTFEKGRISTRRYWRLDLPQVGEHSSPSREAASEFADHLKRTTREWMKSDVPVASLLSGGIDSASLAAFAKEAGSPPQTFSLSFSSADYDERYECRRTALHLGTTHHETEFSSGAFEQLEVLVRHLEQPLCSTTGLALFSIYQECQRYGFKVALTGEGADELLGGYHWVIRDQWIRNLLKIPYPLRWCWGRLHLPTPPGVNPNLFQNAEGPVGRYAEALQIASPEKLQLLLGDSCPPIQEQWRDRFSSELANRHPFDQFQILDSQLRLVDFINLEVDRSSMAASVEARTPFLDHRLWEWCAHIHPQEKLRLGYSKILLRKGMKGRLPNEVRNRPKRGLATPHADWWRRKLLPDWVEDHMTPSALTRGGFFQVKEVGQLRELHSKGVENVGNLLTGILMTQMWRQEYKRWSE